MTKNLCLVIFALLAEMSNAQETLRVSPGLTSERLEIRDPQGRITMTVERSTTGRLIIKKPDGALLGSITEPKRREGTREKKTYLSLPPSWKK